MWFLFVFASNALVLQIIFVWVYFRFPYVSLLIWLSFFCLLLVFLEDTRQCVALTRISCIHPKNFHFGCSTNSRFFLRFRFLGTTERLTIEQTCWAWAVRARAQLALDLKSQVAPPSTSSWPNKVRWKWCSSRTLIQLGDAKEGPKHSLNADRFK